MKKNQQKVTDLLVIGKDELNLCECPFTLLSDKVEEDRKTLEFRDRQNGITRHWTISGSDKYGLPCALDESVFMAMLFLSKRNGFINQKTYFNSYEILKLMKWPISGHQYKRLELALSRLSGVTIYADYLWDQGKFKEGKFIFHIIDDAFLDKGKRDSKNSWFKWGDRLFESFLNGNIKNLDLDTYFSLSTAISLANSFGYGIRGYTRLIKYHLTYKSFVMRNSVYPEI